MHMKIVIDTNVFVNFFRSSSRNSASVCVVKDVLINTSITPLIGNALFTEYEDVLSRAELRESSVYTMDEVAEIMDAYYSRCLWKNIRYIWRPNLRDEGDNHLLDLAVSGNARYIITNNVRDLNSGDLKFSIKVVSPSDYLSEVKQYGDN